MNGRYICIPVEEYEEEAKEACEVGEVLAWNAIHHYLTKSDEAELRVVASEVLRDYGSNSTKWKSLQEIAALRGFKRLSVDDFKTQDAADSLS